MALRISGTNGIQDGEFNYEDEIVNRTTKDYVDSKPTGFKNYIINGNFDIWQRGVTQTISGYGSDDRWHNANAGSTKVHSAVACGDTERALFNAAYFSRTVVTSVPGVNNYVNKLQAIEDVTRLAGKTVTLSFWARADSEKNITIEFGQRFGTGGSPSIDVLGISQIIPLTTTWQKVKITLTLPNIIGKTIGSNGFITSSTMVSFLFDAGSNFNSRTLNLGQQSGTFDIAQVQLEEGSVATNFENRLYEQELSLCLRYFEKTYTYGIYAGNNSQSFDGPLSWYGGAARPMYYFKVTKRITPTVTIYSPLNGSIGYYYNGTSSSPIALIEVNHKSLRLNHAPNTSAYDCSAHFYIDAEF